MGADYVVERDGKYYNGENGKKELKIDGIEKLIKENVLFRLENPAIIKKDKTLWLTPNYEVYSSSKLNPLGKIENRTFICKIGV